MKVPIFSEEEMHERFRLRNFLHNHFDFYKEASEQFPQGIEPEDIAEIYGAQHPDSCMTESMIVHFLETSGYLLSPEVVYCNIKLEGFFTFKDNVKLKLINMVDPKTAITLTQLTVHKAMPEELPLESFGREIVQLFLKHMVFYSETSSNHHFQEVRLAMGYATANSLYNYYVEYCSRNHMPFTNKRGFFDHLRECKLEPVKGYCQGRSGVQYYHKLVIPTNYDDLQESLKYNCGIITLNDNVKKIAPDFTIKGEDEENILVRISEMNTRECEIIEQKTTPGARKAQKERTNDRGANQAETLSVSERTEETEPEDNIRDNVRLYADNTETSEIIEAEATEPEVRTYADHIEGEWVGSEVRFADSTEDRDSSDEYNDENSDSINTDEYPDDADADRGSTESGEDASGDSEELPTIEAVVKALKIPYMMDKEHFDEEQLKFYLGIMPVPKECYDDLPGLLQKIKEA